MAQATGPLGHQDLTVQVVEVGVSEGERLLEDCKDGCGETEAGCE